MTTDERVAAIQVRHDEKWALLGGAVTPRQSEVDRAFLLDIVRDLTEKVEATDARIGVVKQQLAHVTAERDRLRGALEAGEAGDA